MKIEAKVRNNISLTSHPVGCARLVDEQIAAVGARGRFEGPRNALIIGSSNGYGLASRLVLAFGAATRTLGVFYEKPAAAGSPGSAGWYNTVAFMRSAGAAGIPAWNINGDAFTTEVKDSAVAMLREHTGPVDLVVYSVAAPRRTDPVTGVTYQSAIKPIGRPHTTRNIDWKTKQMVETTMEPATAEEIDATVKVMGGEDWELWLGALQRAGLLARGVMAVAYSYIGPEVTHSTYRDGTMGRAKKHLEDTTRRLDRSLQASLGGRCLVSVNKALVTRASAVIPAVPFYISLLYRVMKERGTHEGCLEQMIRLFYDRLYSGGPLLLDEEHLIRMDDLEMDPEVQEEVARLWNEVTTETLYELADARGYRDEFFQSNGFEVPGVDYGADVDLAEWASLDPPRR